MTTPFPIENVATARFSPIPGFKLMLIGPPGTGKSTALTSLAKIPGIKARAIFTDPNFSAGLFPGLEYKYLVPATSRWKDLIDVATKVNTMSMASLQNMDMGRLEYKQYLEILGACNNFVSVDGTQLGDATTWGTDTVLIFDGLSGISKAARMLTVGGKPNPTQPEWGAMMSLVENFLLTIATTTWCHVIVITHIEPEKDEVTGAVKNMISTLGRKLAPSIPKDYSDVVLAVKQGAAFTWDTAAISADLKATNLPIAAGQKPDFAPVFEKWKSRGGIISPVAPRPEEIIKAYADMGGAKK